jgi:class 3 adenylate cyclase
VGDVNEQDDTHEQHVKQTSIPVRLDMVEEVISVDEESRTVRVIMRPDPRRYTAIEDGEETLYLDRFFNIAFRPEDFANKSMSGIPMFASGATIKSATDYAGKRLAAIETELRTGEYDAPTEKARIHAPLAAAGIERHMSFLSVDICGSTVYRHRDPVGFDVAQRILVQELGTAVGQFQGALLKTTGDGFIAYIDGPGFTVLADNTVDLGGSMLQLLKEAINPALEAAGHAPLSIRIGADYGPAFVREVRVPMLEFTQPDVTSDALNRAVKIEKSCSPNTLRIGYDLYRCVHVQWLERCREVEFDGAGVGVEHYRVFEVA